MKMARFSRSKISSENHHDDGSVWEPARSSSGLEVSSPGRAAVVAAAVGAVAAEAIVSDQQRVLEAVVVVLCRSTTPDQATPTAGYQPPYILAATIATSSITTATTAQQTILITLVAICSSLSAHRCRVENLHRNYRCFSAGAARQLFFRGNFPCSAKHDKQAFSSWAYGGLCWKNSPFWSRLKRSEVLFGFGLSLVFGPVLSIGLCVAVSLFNSHRVVRDGSASGIRCWRGDWELCVD